jgi:alginate O-acetyltransferase complex protein AlgJ
MEVIAPSSTIASEPRVVARPVSIRRATDALLVSLFIAGIGIPLLGVKIRGHGWDVAARGENRTLAAEPRIFHLGENGPVTRRARISGWVHFPGEFKAYLTDHFGFRNLLIKLHGILMVEGLKTTSTHMVELGKDGWLYLANDGSIDDYRNLEPWTDEELAQWRQVIEERQAFCDSLGVKYLFVVAPSKHDIYPEYMPDRFTRVHEEARLDQLLAYMKQCGSKVDILDLRPALIEAKKSGIRLFHKTDTHWNDHGAWAAYLAIMQRVKAKVPGVRILSESDFKPAVSIDPGMDLARLCGLNDQLNEECLNLDVQIPLRLPKVKQDDVIPINIEGRGPRAVVFRDSFLTSLLPWIAEGFGHGVYLWEDGFDTDVVTKEKPDIVIQEIAQRKFMQPAQGLRLIQKVKFENGKWVAMGLDGH